MPADFPLESLDPETFEQIAVALSRAVVGNGVTVFGRGPDGGREATYEGPVQWSNTTGFGDDSWAGYVVLQAKHRAALDPDPGRNVSWLRAQLERELDRWVAPQSTRMRFPEYLLIVTNARLSPAVGGGIETIEEYLQQRWTDQLRARGLKHWKVWHRDQVASLLVQHEGVRRAFPSFLTSPNDKLIERFEKLEAFFEPRATYDLLVEHAAAALRNEQWVNFGEAGEDSQQPLHRVIVDLPVRCGASRGRALQQLMRQGEKVLRRSLISDGAPRHVVVTGAPGNGKSTLSRYLVQLYRAAFMAKDIPSPALHDLAKGTKASMDRIGLKLPRQQRWPMRIDLADWASGDGRYSDYVIKWLAYKIAERAGQDVSVANVRRWLNEWPWLIVFDGLDEVTAPGVRRDIVNGIAEFIDEVDTADADVLVVVTTRPGGYTDELPAEHFAEYELDYLSEREAIDYGELVTQGRMAEDQDRRNEVLTRFRAAIADPATTRLLKTPLQVLIITFILEHAGALPPNRYGLFWTYYETLFKRETSKKNPLARFLSQRGQDITHLHEMVGATLQSRSEDGQDSHARLSLSDVRQIADQRLRTVGYDDEIERHKLTEQMVAAATRRLVLLVPGGQDHTGDETVMFEVRSLQELMAARHLSQGTPAQVRPRLTALAPSPHWRNTWVFMAGRLFAEPSDLSWNIVTEVLSTYDTATDWPGWLIPIAPGLAADLLDDGLATTKPRWQAQLLDLALRALSEPLPVDLSLVTRGLAAASVNPTYQRITLAAMKRALQGTESSRYAAARLLEEADAITPPHTSSQLVPEFVIRSGRIKGRNRISAYDLLEPELRQLGPVMSTPVLVEALEELKTLQLLEVGDQTFGVRPKTVAGWAGLLAALENPDGRAALELAAKAADPHYWRLIHFIALEVFPALARATRGSQNHNVVRERGEVSEMGSGSAIELPVPLALARSAETLTPSRAREPRFEPKWDGYRALVAGGRIWSRTGTDLGRFFPDLVPVLRSRLPANAVLDGELVAWDVARGRLDFSALQARLTAGRRITSVAARRPAQLICFDLLADSDGDLRGRPLSERRARLTDMLLGQAPPVVLCQQTSDLGVAEDWFATLSAGGIEGIVVKDAAAPYPTDRGQRVWWKVKARQVLDLLAIGVLGDLGAPTALVLAAPDASARVVGVTTVLPRAVARALAPLLQATGSTWERLAGWTSSGPSVVSAVEPVVVEVSADVAVDDGVLRHAARRVRVRPDLQPNDLLD